MATKNYNFEKEQILKVEDVSQLGEIRRTYRDKTIKCAVLGAACLTSYVVSTLLLGKVNEENSKMMLGLGVALPSYAGAFGYAVLTGRNWTNYSRAKNREMTLTKD